ncbi:MAG: hypothetical protein U0835_07930 [Isosphaeraceae bacterium]
MPTRWVGIDEAGYGPNLGPLVMTAVVAESPDQRKPDLWGDLAGSVARAGGNPGRLWVDDSKAVYKGGQNRERLDAACLAVLTAVSARNEPNLGADSAPNEPRPAKALTLDQVFQALRAGTVEEVELRPWLEPGGSPEVGPGPASDPFDGAPWRLVSVRAAIVGPARFNQGLDRHGSKAGVHFDAFAELLKDVWESAPAGVDVVVSGDKHGGRHFYYEPLLSVFPDAWIDRGPEGPSLSRYTVRQGGRRLELSLRPRADGDDGLVALASLVSKSVREHWMDVFNAYWARRVPGLSPTAGYPVDASRFRRELEAAIPEGLPDPSLWWRRK